jgi:hypothetical protein
VVRIVVGIVVAACAAFPIRAHADDDACERARAAMKGKDYLRASVAAAECGDAAVGVSVAKAATKAGWSEVEVITEPEGGTVAVGDVSFTAPRVIWLPPGQHDVRGIVDGRAVVSALAIARDGRPTFVRLDLRVARAEPKNGSVDFGEEGGGEVATGPPPKVELPSLLPEKYLRGVEAKVSWDEDAPPPRPTWRLAVGPTLAFAGGDRGWGGTVAVAHRSRFWVLGGPVDVTPEAAVMIGREPGNDGSMDSSAIAIALRGTVLVELEAPLGLRWDGFAGVGPAVHADLGDDDDFTGTTLAVAIAGELARRPSGWTVGARADVPVVSSATRAPFTASVLLGRRW